MTRSSGHGHEMLRRLLPRAAAGPSWMAALRPPHPQSSQLMLVATRGARTNRQAGGHGTRNGGGKGGKGKSRRQAVPALVTVPELCTADRLARELRLSFEELVAKAEGLGEEISGPSQPLDTELLELLAIEAGAEGINVLAVDLGRRPMPSAEERAKLPLRPPVVTLMGHVDHGKTSMLDAFRGSSIAAGEAGGITQSISAFTVDAGTPSAITFIDTPGHELFAAMRQRGAHATDLVVLVVAVDAGVQPTTVQAIEYARGTSAPLVVAINKMDRDGAEREYPKVVDQLLAQGVVPEDMGGEVPFVRVSAKTGLNLDELRDTLLLQAELLELHAEDDGPAEGVVLEASLQKGLGIVTSLLVQRGCLMPNDYVVAGASWGKAKVLLSAEGNQRLKRAPPSTPVRLAGLKELPRTGDDVYVVASEAKAKEAVEYYAARQHLARVAVLEGERQLELDVRLEAQRKKAELEVAEGRTPWFIKKAQARHQLREQRQAEARGAAIARRMDLGPQVTTEIGAPNLVPVLLKADSAGSLEAVHESLRHFPTDRVQLQIVKSDLGTVTEGDVTLAESLGATIVGFNVSAPSKVAQQAEKAEVAGESVPSHGRQSCPVTLCAGPAIPSLPVAFPTSRPRP